MIYLVIMLQELVEVVMLQNIMFSNKKMRLIKEGEGGSVTQPDIILNKISHLNLVLF